MMSIYYTYYILGYRTGSTVRNIYESMYIMSIYATMVVIYVHGMEINTSAPECAPAPGLYNKIDSFMYCTCLPAPGARVRLGVHMPRA